MENLLSGQPVVVALDLLIDELYQGNLHFDREPARASNGGQPSKIVPYLDPSDAPPHIREIGRFRLEVIRPLVGKGSRTRADVTARVAEVNRLIQIGEVIAPENILSVSVPSVYRWIALYECSGQDARVLYPEFEKRGPKGKARVRPEVDMILTSVIDDLYKVREKKTINDVLHESAVRIKEENLARNSTDRLAVPVRSTIARRIDRLDMRERFALRHGKRAVDRQFSQFSTGPEAEMPNDVWEIDSTPIDLIVVDDQDNLPLGRCTLTDVIDRCLRYPAGYYLGFEPPSYYSVMEALYHAIRPKTDVRQIYGLQHDWLSYGIPVALVTDNGKEFIGLALTDACEALNITLVQMPVKKPHYKGKVERYFRTKTFMLHGLPGTTFSNPQERQDYDSMGYACIYLSEVDQILHNYLIDVYAESEHRGLNGIPARRWETAIRNGFIPRVPANSEDILILLGQVDRRAVQPYGIQLENLLYNAPTLASLRNRLGGEKAKIKYHPGDLSKIYVYNPFDREYLIIPVEDKYQDYVQELSLWKHRVVTRFLGENRDRSDPAALGEAKRRIQDIVDAAKGRVKGSARQKMARWQQGGKPASAPKKKSPPVIDAPAHQPQLPPQEESHETPGLPVPIETVGLGQGTEDDDWEIRPNAIPSKHPQEVTS